MTTPNPPPADQPPDGQILIYRDGSTQLRVRLDGQTVWLPQRLIAELFQVTVATVNEHLKGIYEDGEVDPEATIRKFRIVQTEGTRQVSRLVDHYNLDAILAVGYRVRSARGTQFRQWATARLTDLLAKGFTLDDERIKAGRTLGDDYFEELLARIRDIRSSERMFYQKITDIYATSIDYDANAELTKTFFQTVQNKMHWAAHGRTAAEVARLRADASQPNMGLTNWKNAHAGPVRKADVSIAKNYLQEDEIRSLNLIVSAYLVCGNPGDQSASDAHGRLDRQTRRLLKTCGTRCSDERRQDHAPSGGGPRPCRIRQVRSRTPSIGSDPADERLRSGRRRNQETRSSDTTTKAAKVGNATDSTRTRHAVASGKEPALSPVFSQG